MFCASAPESNSQQLQSSSLLLDKRNGAAGVKGDTNEAEMNCRRNCFLVSLCVLAELCQLAQTGNCEGN